MKNILTLILLSTILYSCKKEKGLPMAYVSASEHEKCEELALTNGDTSAYDTLSMEFRDSPNEGVFLYTALIMANKYNYERAYYDAYMCLTDSFHKQDNEELDDLDSQTKKLALDLLFRGVKANNGDCKSILGHQYVIGKHLPKDKVKGEKLIAESY